MGGIFDTLTNIVGETINVIHNVAGGLVKAGANVIGGAVNLAGVVLNDAGQIVGNLVRFKLNVAATVINAGTAIVEGVLNGAGQIIGHVVNSAGSVSTVLIDVVGNVFDAAGKLLGNIFEVKGNLVKAIVNSVRGIVGEVTQIAGNILKVKIAIFGRFVKLMAQLVGALSKLSNDLVNIFGAVLNELTKIVSDITTCFDKFFTGVLAEFPDFILYNPLKDAKVAYGKVVVAVADAIAKAKVNIADQVNAFDAKIKAELATAVNQVNNLAADLTEKLNSADVSAELKAKCGAQLNSSLENFGGKDIPYLTQCLEEFDLNAIANKAVTTAGGTLTQAKSLVASYETCLAPVRANLKDTKAKSVARECLIKLTQNAPTEQQALIDVVNQATSTLTADLDKAGQDATDCLQQKSEEAVLGAQYIGEDLDACLAGN